MAIVFLLFDFGFIHNDLLCRLLGKCSCSVIDVATAVVDGGVDDADGGGGVRSSFQPNAPHQLIATSAWPRLTTGTSARPSWVRINYIL